MSFLRWAITNLCTFYFFTNHVTYKQYILDVYATKTLYDLKVIYLKPTHRTRSFPVCPFVSLFAYTIHVPPGSTDLSLKRKALKSPKLKERFPMSVMSCVTREPVLRVQYKLAVTVHRCLWNEAVSDVAAVAGARDPPAAIN